jgi:diguanylate cyclase (GGDEF)-like protein
MFRLLFNDRLENALARASRRRTHVALLFIDLDRFKTINDTLGHPVGDQLLQEVA